LAAAHCKTCPERLASAKFFRRDFQRPGIEASGDQMPTTGGPQDLIVQFAPILLIFVMFYFLMIRPQQKRAKDHAALLSGIKRNDVVVLSSGLKGKVVRVEDTEVGLEIAQGVTVKVVKSMIADVQTKGDPVIANDRKD
jgi:preprotein translocase subunit YajC